MTTIALFGSGEFQPWARPADQLCLERSTATGDRVLVLPTASAPEGDDVFDRWARMGIEHYTALGMRPEALPVKTRADAEDPAMVERVSGARLIYFSGGNPGYLARTLGGTPFWDAVARAAADGVAVGGCSAGAVAFGCLAPDVAGDGVRAWEDGLGLVPAAFVVPHFDALEGYQPGLQQRFLSQCPPERIPIGIDEDTAMVGDGHAWRVFGVGAVWIPGTDGTLEPHRDGDEVALRLTETIH